MMQGIDKTIGAVTGWIILVLMLMLMLSVSLVAAAAAIGKDTRPDGRHCPGQGNTTERNAALKRPLADGLQAAGKGHLVQPGLAV